MKKQVLSCSNLCVLALILQLQLLHAPNCSIIAPSSSDRSEFFHALIKELHIVSVSEARRQLHITG